MRTRTYEKRLTGKQPLVLYMNSFINTNNFILASPQIDQTNALIAKETSLAERKKKKTDHLADVSQVSWILIIWDRLYERLMVTLFDQVTPTSVCFTLTKKFLAALSVFLSINKPVLCLGMDRQLSVTNSSAGC